MQHADATYLGLKTQFRRLVKAAGGLEPAAEMVRVGKSRLADYYDPNGEHHAPIDVVADLEAATGCSYVTEYMARLRGGRLDPVEGCLSTTALEVNEWVGALSGMVRRFQSDHSEGGRKITVNERQQIQAATDRGREKLDEFDRVADGNMTTLKEVG